MDNNTLPVEPTEIPAVPEAAHEVRITSHGKMNAWVEFALKFFEVSRHHTLRPASLSSLHHHSRTGKPKPPPDIPYSTRTATAYLY